MWDGSILKKSLAAVIFVPISKMTAHDWRVLDFENLRPVAKNRIAEAAATRDLIGFLHVTALQKGNKRDGYYSPATQEIRDRAFEGDNSWFTNDPDGPLLSVEAIQLQKSMDSFGLLSTAAGLILAARLLDFLIGSNEFEKAQQVAEAVESGERLEAQDEALRLVLMSAWTKELDELEQLAADIDEMPDSDDKDEAEDLVRESIKQLRALSGG